MRILYIHQHFRTPEQSGGTRSYEFARRLACKGHQVIILTADQEVQKERKDWAVKEIDGFTVHVFAQPYSNQMNSSERFRAFFRFMIHASARAVSWRPHLVIASSTPLTVAVPALVAKLWHRIPLVFEVRDLWPDVPIALGYLTSPVSRAAALALEHVTYFLSDHIIALSPGMASAIARKTRGRVPVTVIPNASDRTLFDNASGDENSPYSVKANAVVYAGTLGFVNNPMYMLEVAAVLQAMRSEVSIDIIGTGREAEAVRIAVVERGISDDYLRLLDPIPKRRLAALLPKYAAGISTVRDEEALWHNSANKVFDYFAAALPVVLNHEGWLADLLNAERAGLILPANDHALAAKLLNDYMKDGALRQAHGQNSQRLARTRFDRDRLSANFIEIVETTAASKRSGWVTRLVRRHTGSQPSTPFGPNSSGAEYSA